MAELDRAQISARMKDAREQAGLTQREIADLLLTHYRTVQEWENIKNANVPWDRLEDWARATGVSRDWLLTGQDAIHPPPTEEVRETLRLLAETAKSLVDLLTEQRQLVERMTKIAAVLERREAASGGGGVPRPDP